VFGVNQKTTSFSHARGFDWFGLFFWSSCKQNKKPRGLEFARGCFTVLGKAK